MSSWTDEKTPDWLIADAAEQARQQDSHDIVTLKEWLKCRCGGWLGTYHIQHSNGLWFWQARCSKCSCRSNVSYFNPIEALTAYHKEHKP